MRVELAHRRHSYQTAISSFLSPSLCTNARTGLRELSEVPGLPIRLDSTHELYLPIAPGEMYVYPFGAVVTYDIDTDRRAAEMECLRRLVPRLTAQVVVEDYTVAEDAAFQTGVSDGMLRVDRFTPGRAGIVALTVAQSAAMEYYERIVDEMFARTGTFVERLEQRGRSAVSHPAASSVYRTGDSDAQRSSLGPAPARQARCDVGRPRNGSDSRWGQK